MKSLEGIRKDDKGILNQIQASTDVLSRNNVLNLQSYIDHVVDHAGWMITRNQPLKRQ